MKYSSLAVAVLCYGGCTDEVAANKAKKMNLAQVKSHAKVHQKNPAMSLAQVKTHAQTKAKVHHNSKFT